MPRARVIVDNPADGGLAYWLLKLYSFVLITLPCLGVAAGGWLYIYFANQLPPLPDLNVYAQTAPAMTKLHIMPGPAFCEAAAVRTKIPVPMMAPMPSRVSWTGPSDL